MLYHINKNFHRYKNTQIFSQIAKIKNTNSSSLLDKIKKENNEKYKDQILTKNALDKYWKEPMACH
jgi:hypothetical protein